MPHVEILDAHGLGKRLKMNPVSLRRLASRGEIPCLRVGGRIRFEWPGILAQLEQRGTPAAQN